MQRTMRMCSVVGVILGVCVVLASVLLWDNMGLPSLCVVCILSLSLSLALSLSYTHMHTHMHTHNSFFLSYFSLSLSLSLFVCASTARCTAQIRFSSEFRVSF